MLDVIHLIIHGKHQTTPQHKNMIKEKFMKWKIILLKDWNDSLDRIIKGTKPSLKKSVPEKKLWESDEQKD